MNNLGDNKNLFAEPIFQLFGHIVLKLLVHCLAPKSAPLQQPSPQPVLLCCQKQVANAINFTMLAGGTNDFLARLDLLPVTRSYTYVEPKALLYDGAVNQCVIFSYSSQNSKPLYYYNKRTVNKCIMKTGVDLLLIL